MPPIDPEMVAPCTRSCAGKASICGWAVRWPRSSRAQRDDHRGDRERRAVRRRLVILAVGVRPDTKLAREAGLEIGPTGGIRVDDQMRTSDPAIFAVGDAVEVRDFVTGRRR